MPPEQPSPPGVLPHQTDAALFLLLKADHIEALGILYDRHAELVYSIALKLLTSAQEAEDLTQDIFLALQQSSYDPRRGSLRTYLAVLTRSRAIDRLRMRRSAQKRLQQQAGQEADQPIADAPEEQLLQTERSQEVQAALAQIPEVERDVLQLAYYEGLSLSTIAQQTNLPLGTVKSRARRGLLKLRASLSQCFGTP